MIDNIKKKRERDIYNIYIIRKNEVNNISKKIDIKK